jgi:pimeloyl-ACP methyl ester carboxylesterase
VSTTWTWTENVREIGPVGVAIRYLDAGRAGAGARPRTLVALHGLQAHGDAWRPSVELLTHVDRVICPDFRGHGRSDWSRDGYWLANYAEDIVGLVDDLGLDRFDLVGHSLGARVSMILCARLPGRLRTTTLIDTGPEVSRAAGLQARDRGMTKQRVDGFRDLDAVREFVVENSSAFTAESVELRVNHLYRRNWAGMYVMRGDREVIWILGRAGLREVPDMWAGLRAAEQPVMVIRAANSFLLDEDIAARMVDALRRPTFVTLDADHFAMYNAPDLLARTLDGFLDQSLL